MCDEVEGHGRGNAEWLPFPVPGVGDVLDRLDGQHASDRDAVEQSETETTPDPWVEGGLIDPCLQAAGSRDQREQCVPVAIHLGLELDTEVGDSHLSVRSASAYPSARALQALDRACQSFQAGLRIGEEHARLGV